MVLGRPGHGAWQAATAARLPAVTLIRDFKRKKTMTMVMSKEEEIFDAMRSVIDPEIGLNVVELGLIRNLDYDHQANKSHVTMILTTPFCPYGPAMIDQVRQAVTNVTQGETVVEIGTELWDPSMMEEGAGGDWGLF
jgi:metal-sulfur cluster biosynthetic enzyme